MTNLEYIAANLSDEDILCQIAEEAAELAQAALKLRRVITQTNPTPVTSIDALRTFIMNRPVADVEEVKYGEWIYDSNTDEPRCSECGEDAIDGVITPYCPYCGAKMRGGE